MPRPNCFYEGEGGGGEEVRGEGMREREGGQGIEFSQ